MEELCSPGPDVKPIWILGSKKQTNKMELLNNVERDETSETSETDEN